MVPNSFCRSNVATNVCEIVFEMESSLKTHQIPIILGSYSKCFPHFHQSINEPSFMVHFLGWKMLAAFGLAPAFLFGSGTDATVASESVFFVCSGLASATSASIFRRFAAGPVVCQRKKTQLVKPLLTRIAITFKQINNNMASCFLRLI